MPGNGGEGALAEGSATDQPVAESSAVQGMKKGPWTAAEDAVLVEYVRMHGEGNWNSVQKNTGLMRCGKSCRLRWANHLRPDLKKGAFSAEEERIVVELHAKYGNKWARMATQLPGRTDNEIKNYWNTRMKRRQRSNLPLYPDGVRKSSNLQQRMHQQHHPQPPHSQRGGYGFDPSPYPFYPAASFTIPSIQTLHNQPFFVHSEPNHHQFLLNNFNGSFSFPIPSALSFFDRSIPASLLQNPNPNPNPNPLPMNPPGIFDGHLTGLGAMMVGAPIKDSAGNESSTNDELLSSQHQSVVPALTPSSSTPNSSDCLIGTPSSYSHNEYYDIEQQLKDQNSGLVDSLLQEAKNIGSKKENFDDEDDSSAARCHGKRTVEENQNQSFIGPKAMEEARLDDYIFSMDDDLSSLLINFPSAMPRPDWYRGGSNSVLTQQSSSPLEDSATGLDICSDGNAAPLPAAATASEFDWSTRTSCWKNMPGIH